MKEVNSFKLYFHLNPITKNVFYVGIGLGSRYCDRSHRNRHWENYVNKYGFEPKIIEEGLTKDEATRKEIYWIKFFGRRDKNEGELLNYTDGGEGRVGSIVSEYTKQKMSIASKARVRPTTLTEDHKRKISQGLTGKVRSEESKKRFSESIKKCYEVNMNMGMRGKKVSDATKLKISEANKISQKGKKYSEERKLQMSISRTGHKLSEETKRKIGDRLRGKKLSPERVAQIVELLKKRNPPTEEQKRKISESMKRHFYMKKQKVA